MFDLSKLRLFALGVATFSCLVAIYFRIQIYKLESVFDNKKKEKEYYYHFISTTIESADCREHMNTREVCSETCSYAHLQKIVKFLASAQYTISMCMYTASLDTIMLELISARQRGVKVRVITDWEMTRTNKNISRACKSKGIELRTQGEKDLGMMHHKFCLVDEESGTNGKVFFGSLNLTMQGLCGNFEQVLFTNDSSFVDRFKDEFHYLWTLFSDR